MVTFLVLFVFVGVLVEFCWSALRLFIVLYVCVVTHVVIVLEFLFCLIIVWLLCSFKCFCCIRCVLCTSSCDCCISHRFLVFFSGCRDILVCTVIGQSLQESGLWVTVCYSNRFACFPGVGSCDTRGVGKAFCEVLSGFCVRVLVKVLWLSPSGLCMGATFSHHLWCSLATCFGILNVRVLN